MNSNEKILKIMKLALDINSFDVPYKGEAKPVVFVRFSGHCPCLSVDIHTLGWNAKTKRCPTLSIYAYHYEESKLDRIIKHLEKIIEDLRNVN